MFCSKLFSKALKNKRKNAKSQAINCDSENTTVTTEKKIRQPRQSTKKNIT